MNQTEFTYWLQGFFELSESTTLNEKQVQIIKDHLKLVFTKVTPTYQPNITMPITQPIYQPGTGVIWPQTSPLVTPTPLKPLDVTCGSGYADGNGLFSNPNLDIKATGSIPSSLTSDLLMCSATNNTDLCGIHGTTKYHSGEVVGSSKNTGNFKVLSEAEWNKRND